MFHLKGQDSILFFGEKNTFEKLKKNLLEDI